MALSISSALVEIRPQCGAAFRAYRGDLIHIVATHAEQVADLALFVANDPRDGFSSGRTVDYNARIALRADDILYSHRSTPLARIVEDASCPHDILLAPCSAVMFERRGARNHRSCHANLCKHLRRFGIGADDVTSTVNVFMDVRVGASGEIRIHPPPVKPGDRFTVQALCDLVVGVTACSSELTNNGSCKPIAYGVTQNR